MLINTNKYPSHFVDKETKYKVYTIDATSIVMKVLGIPIPNTAMLGAFVKIFNKIPLEILKKSIEKEFAEEGKENLIKKNKDVVEVCYNELVV